MAAFLTTGFPKRFSCRDIVDPTAQRKNSLMRSACAWCVCARYIVHVIGPSAVRPFSYRANVAVVTRDVCKYRRTDRSLGAVTGRFAVSYILARSTALAGSISIRDPADSGFLAWPA